MSPKEQRQIEAQSQAYEREKWRIDDKLMSPTELAALFKERDEAREWARKLQTDTQVLTCVFCGKSYPPGTPNSGAKALLDHILICPQHPVRDLASNYDFAIDAMRTTQRLFNLSDRHLLMQACLNMEATAERFEKLRGA